MGEMRFMQAFLLVFAMAPELQRSAHAQPASVPSYCSPHDRPSLLAINKSLASQSWKGENCCSWAGVGCNSQGRVTQLSLGDPSFYHQVAADFPWSDLCLMDQLTVIHLIYLGLSGPIPSCIADLHQLTVLELMGNFLNGSVPSGIFDLHLLRELILVDNRLSGSIPESVCNLHHLEMLGLVWNDFEKLPKCIDTLTLLTNLTVGPGTEWHNTTTVLRLHMGFLHTLVNLRFLVVHGEVLWEGGVPSLQDLERLSFLEYLGLRSGGLNGTFTGRSIAMLSRLKWLDLSSNSLVGTIPREIGKLSNLTRLLLTNNLLNGRLPPALTSCSQLQILDLGDNHFQGAIPHELGNLSSLQLIDFGNNNLTGTLEDFGLSHLSLLRVLILASNNLHGYIPDWLGGFSWLNIIDLSNNLLSGIIPPHLQLQAFRTTIELHVPWYSSLAKLELHIKGIILHYTFQHAGFSFLNLAANSLNGTIPPCLGNLTYMWSLNVSRNHLTGPIPATFVNLVVMESLDLSFNHLEGPIPSQFSRLTNISVFDVSFNNLIGPLPQGNQFSAYPYSYFQGNDGLCGPTMLKACNTSAPKSNLVVPLATTTSILQRLQMSVSLQAIPMGYVLGVIIMVWLLRCLRVYEGICKGCSPK